MKTTGQNSFHLVGHMHLDDYNGVAIDIKMIHSVIHETHRWYKTNLEAKRI